MAAYKFFMFDPENGFTTYKTAEEAKVAAEDSIHWYRGDACDGWPDEVEHVYWGEIKQHSQQCGLRPRDDQDKSKGDMICDYQLSDI